VGEVRGVGLMLGIEIVDPVTGAGDPARARSVQRTALEQGLILEVGGRDDCVIRLLPPLNITRETMDQALDILVGAIAAAAEPAALTSV